MTTAYLIMISLTIITFVILGTKLALLILPRFQMFDVPNDRSNHTKPVVRGGGIVVMFTIISFMFVTVVAYSNILLAAILLMVVSFIDDVRPIPARWRFVTQLAAVCLAITSFEGLVFQGLLPYYLDRAVVAILWLWFINLYNFMDGIDGITANQCITNSIGFVLLFITAHDQANRIPLDVATDSIVMGSALLGFLFYNRHPAKIFLGDSGSIPLGFLMGYISFTVAGAGYPFAAFIVPAYYLADASLTIAKRIMSGHKVWDAHSEHAYQRAVRAGRSHSEVVRYLFGINLILIILAVVSTLNMQAGIVCFVAAYLFVLFMMRYLTHPRQAHAATA